MSWETHNRITEMENRLDAQLARIERKLNWLRWRLRWGETRKLTTGERADLGTDIVALMPADIGPDPGWPVDGSLDPEST